MIGFMVIMNTLLADRKSYKGETGRTNCPEEGEQE
tara:strand:+ start:398 stop:502 length:105 start_codon:yes stop_codon:yes gene_type:complete